MFENYPLIIAANRDEHYDRPSAPPGSPPPFSLATDTTPPPTADPATAPPPVDPCHAAPRCYNAGPFVAELVDLTPSFSGNNALHFFRANVRFRNATDRPLVLGYVDGSAEITDNNGNRYTVQGNVTQDGVKGMGTIKRNTADPQFLLAPGEPGNVTFNVSRFKVRDPRIGSSFNFIIAVAELEIRPSQEIRTGRQYPVTFSSLTTGKPEF